MAKGRVTETPMAGELLPEETELEGSISVGKIVGRLMTLEDCISPPTRRTAQLYGSDETGRWGAGPGVDLMMQRLTSG